MAWTNPNSPNLPDFLLFIRAAMKIPTGNLPDDAVWIEWAFAQALDLVLHVPCVSGLSYTLAVYNCGGHILVRIAQPSGPPGSTYFEGLRKQFQILIQAAGVVQSSSDESTSNSLAVPDALRQLTIGDLGFFKTPWGREYLSYAQDFGDIFGLT